MGIDAHTHTHPQDRQTDTTLLFLHSRGHRKRPPFSPPWHPRHGLESPPSLSPEGPPPSPLPPPWGWQLTSPLPDLLCSCLLPLSQGTGSSWAAARDTGNPPRPRPNEAQPPCLLAIASGSPLPHTATPFAPVSGLRGLTGQGWKGQKCGKVGMGAAAGRLSQAGQGWGPGSPRGPAGIHPLPPPLSLHSCL